jgi:hypothetical protein
MESGQNVSARRKSLKCENVWTGEQDIPLLQKTRNGMLRISPDVGDCYSTNMKGL